MKSIYGKLIVGFLVSIIVSFSVAGFITIKRNSNQSNEVNYDEIIGYSDYLVTLIETKDEDLLIDYANTLELDFMVNNNEQSYEFGDLYNSLLLSDSEQEELYEEVGNIIYKSKGNLRQVSKSYEISDHVIIITLQKDFTERQNVFLSSAIIALFCVFVTGSIMFLIIADIIVKPISRLTHATNELSKGNYRVRVNYSGDDEIAKLNRSFNQMAQQLAKSEETRQQFISDISHEFQTPLTAIQGFATILKNEQLPDALREKYADIILFHSKRLSTLSKSMLELTLLEREDMDLHKSEYSLTQQLFRVINVQEPMANDKNIEIEYNYPKGDVLVMADEERMEEVWINLLNNAIKYTNDGGVVTITIRKYNAYVEVSVEDTGIGMSQEAISHIFERFYRSDKSRNIEGNGLGLSIVKRIIDLHNGNIGVVSTEDAGSVFTVRLPDERNFLEKISFTKKEEKGSV